MLRSILVLNPKVWGFGLDMRRRLNRLTKRPFDSTFRALQAFRPPEGKIFVDVGANNGESVEAMRLYHPSVPIVAFEPAAATFATLKRTVGHLNGVTLHQCGLSDEPGSFTLYTPTANGSPLPALASGVYAEAAGWIERFAGKFSKIANVKIVEETVTVRTLDEMNLSPGLLKIDVQGFEARVLTGGLETVKRCMPVVLVEQSPNDGIAEILGPLGYRAYRWGGESLVEGAEGVANAYYLTDAHRPQMGLPPA